MEARKEVIEQLKKDLLKWEGYRAAEVHTGGGIGLGKLEQAFPEKVFPEVALHEFVSKNSEQHAATTGFIAGVLSKLATGSAPVLWLGRCVNVYPPALAGYHIHPHRVFFVQTPREKDLLWILEEALKCPALGAVVAELRGLNFMQSRRLQLALESGRTTALVIRDFQENIQATVCAARWQINPLPAELPDGLPGVGFAKWHVELLKVRNGNPCSGVVTWQQGFKPEVQRRVAAVRRLQKVG